MIKKPYKSVIAMQREEEIRIENELNEALNKWEYILNYATTPKVSSKNLIKIIDIINKIDGTYNTSISDTQLKREIDNLYNSLNKKGRNK